MLRIKGLSRDCFLIVLVGLVVGLNCLQGTTSARFLGVLQCDQASAGLRVSGTFRLDSTDAVLANLQATLPIQVKYFTRYWVSVRRVG